MRKRFSSFSMSLNSYLIVILFFSTFKAHAFMDVKTSKNYLRLPSGQELTLVSELPSRCYSEEDNEDLYCFPTNRLFLKEKGGTTKDLTKFVAKWDDFFVHFVQLTSKSHIADLNKDGVYEVAILPNVAGNNVVIGAYIYSVSDGGLLPYGTGKFNIEFGTQVTDLNVRPHLNH